MPRAGPVSRGGGRARTLGITVLVAALLAPSGCSRSTSAAPKLGVDVRQYREDEVAGVLQVTFTSHEGAPVRIDTAALRSPDFSPLPASPADLDLAPGQRTDIPVRFGPAACGDGVPRSARPAAVLVRLARPGSRSADVTLPLPAPNETLDRLLVGTCRREQLARLLQVRYTGLYEEAGGGHQRLTVTLTYTGESTGGLTVTSITGSVIFDLLPLAPAGRAPATVSARSRTASFDIRISTGRCDPHAFAESKKTYQWTLYLSLPGQSATTYLVAVPDRATKATLDSWALHHCGLA